ncbi:hypothetical protein [Pedobacter sp. D749]|uniref:hypothetical protein n=1 Tax=Pedobacter sp. D749 TaxID=2856523 RepID=UPI001C566C40|nr:hypothetical protein [Pedobacter sp. D749]QXU41151.1 hypothetical protein KYH19_19445 [Pedobacter sp. D749]
MNKLIKLIAIGIYISLECCAQNKKDIAAENRILEKIEYQKEGMLFKLKYEHLDCSYEILLNDMPIITYFGLGERSDLTVDINQYILKPGKQEITIRMFPAKKEENLFVSSLSKNSFVKIDITKNKEPMTMLDQLNAKSKRNEYKWETLVYKTPQLEKPMPYSEYKTSFEVDAKDINWKIVGWSKSKKLINDPNIRREVDEFYDNYKKVLEEGNQNKFLSLVRNTIYEEAASKPWNKEIENQLTKNMSDYAVEKRNFIYPCKKAELKFFGNGRVVTLVCADTLTFGYSSLISKTAKNTIPKSHTFYLHKPEGSDKLEIIR